MTQAEFDALKPGEQYGIRLPSGVVCWKVKGVPYTQETRQQSRAIQRIVAKGHAALARAR